MKNIFTAALAAFVLAFAHVSFAGGAVVPYENMVSVLSGHHGAPGDEYWSKLDADHTREVLLKISGDEKVHTIVRARAVLALAHFRTEQTAAVITQKAKSDSLPYLRSAAFESLAKSEGENALKALSDGLKDSDVMVRISVARSIGKIGGAEAKKTLKGSLGSEKDSTAKSVMEKTVEQMR
ncbi:MAG: HEAT repeat domain-containing protein [Nitrospinae bacterium]|nr:HEAT repeat domain-containing protein [Nitrospinota bacterium]